jgi:site-specific recombinase XerD
MGTVRKIGDDYFIEFEARGLNYQRTGGKDKEAARRLLKEVEDKIKKGEMNIVVHDVQASDFFKDFLSFIKNDNDPRTYVRYGSVVGHFQEFTREALSPTCRLSQITPSIIEGYRARLIKSTSIKGRALKPKVINFTFYLLKDVFDQGINFGHINDNPTLHTRLMAITDGKLPRVLGDDEIKDLLNISPEDIRVTIAALLGTGMDIGEIIGLKWTNVDLNNNCLKIRSLPGAARRGRKIPMGCKVLSIIQDLYDQRGENQEFVFVDRTGRQMGQANIMRDFIKAGNAIGTNGASLHHILRNTFAKNMLEKGVSLIGLYKLLGFRDIAKVMRYAGYQLKRDGEL